MSNYPVMSRTELENAPWNKVENQEKKFAITVSQSLSKPLLVATNQYTEEYYGDKEPYYDTSDVCWKEAFEENNYHTPLQLINILKEILENLKKQGLYFKTPGYTNKLIEECSGWTEDECEYVKI